MIVIKPILSVSDQRGVVIHARQKLGVSERRACSVTGIARSTMRYQGAPRDDDALRLEVIRLAKQYGRYALHGKVLRKQNPESGYRMIAELLRTEGWHINHKKVERLWREEGFAPIHTVANHPVDDLRQERATPW